MNLRLLIALVLILTIAPSYQVFASKKATGIHQRKQRLERIKKKGKKQKQRRSNLPAAAGIYIQTLKGDTLLEQSATDIFNPASVMKLATSHAAFRPR